MCNGSGKGGGRLYRTNEGDGVRTEKGRERERGTKPVTYLSYVVFEADHRETAKTKYFTQFYIYIYITVFYPIL